MSLVCHSLSPADQLRSGRRRRTPCKGLAAIGGTRVGGVGRNSGGGGSRRDPANGRLSRKFAWTAHDTAVGSPPSPGKGPPAGANGTRSRRAVLRWCNSTGRASGAGKVRFSGGGDGRLRVLGTRNSSARMSATSPRGKAY